jgi:hypothetical protein
MPALFSWTTFLPHLVPTNTRNSYGCSTLGVFCSAVEADRAQAGSVAGERPQRRSSDAAPAVASDPHSRGHRSAQDMAMGRMGTTAATRKAVATAAARKAAHEYRSHIHRSAMRAEWLDEVSEEGRVLPCPASCVRY